jgi:hypothetical protein
MVDCGAGSREACSAGGSFVAQDPSDTLSASNRPKGLSERERPSRAVWKLVYMLVRQHRRARCQRDISGVNDRRHLRVPGVQYGRLSR